MPIFNMVGGGGFNLVGNKWMERSTLPYDFYSGSAVVLNNEIHIFGGGRSYSYGNDFKSHCKWNGSTWKSVSTLPYDFYHCSAVVLNNEIHILGGVKHYKWNGSTWEKVSVFKHCIAYLILPSSELKLIIIISCKLTSTSYSYFDNFNFKSLISFL
jgi:hypothetical protein